MARLAVCWAGCPCPTALGRVARPAEALIAWPRIWVAELIFTSMKATVTRLQDSCSCWLRWISRYRFRSPAAISAVSGCFLFTIAKGWGNGWRVNHICVVAALTNAWLLARQPGVTPTTRPLAPIRCLQRSGVCVAVGCDNVADPWYPAGGFDPIALMARSLPLAQLAPWQRLGLAPSPRLRQS